jgi:hypothetical protein
VAKDKTTKSVFIDVNQFITFPVLDPDFMNVQNYVRLLKEGRDPPSGVVTPPEIAARARRIAQEARSAVSGIEADGTSMDFELADIRAWALLADYFGLKVEAAVALETFRQMELEAEQSKAAALLEEALQVWIQLSALTDNVYNEVESAKLIWIEKPRLLSWKAFIEDAAYDVTIAKENIQTQLPR